MVCDTTERIPEILSAHQTVNKIILHVGANYIPKSEMLKNDFAELLKILGSIDVEAYVSGHLLNTWLSTACALHKVNFINTSPTLLSLPPNCGKMLGQLEDKGHTLPQQPMTQKSMKNLPPLYLTNNNRRRFVHSSHHLQPMMRRFHCPNPQDHPHPGF